MAISIKDSTIARFNQLKPVIDQKNSIAALLGYIIDNRNYYQASPSFRINRSLVNELKKRVNPGCSSCRTREQMQANVDTAYNLLKNFVKLLGEHKQDEGYDIHELKPS